MTPEWVLAICAILGVLGSILVVMWRLSVTLDRNTIAVKMMADNQTKIIDRIENLTETVNNHSERLGKVETSLSFCIDKD